MPPAQLLRDPVGVVRGSTEVGIVPERHFLDRIGTPAYFGDAVGQYPAQSSSEGGVGLGGDLKSGVDPVKKGLDQAGLPLGSVGFLLRVCSY
jgi:hypothetical protein